MSLPKQVLDREQRSNEAIERIKQGREAPPPANDAPPTQDEQQPPQPKAPAPDVWESRYKALKGKYDAEVPRLSELVRIQQGQVEDLKRQIDTLKTQAPAADTRSNIAADLPEEMRERFDPDMIDAVVHIAQKSAEKAIEPLKPVVEKARTREEEREHALLIEQQRADMIEALNELVPDWQEIDNSAGFKAFLQEPDPATGKPIRETLQQAIERLDAVKTARIFRAFANSAPPKPAAPRAPSLESQQVPDIAGAGSSAPGGDKRIYTRADIRAMSSEIARLAVRNPQKAAEIEREIDLAHREGRIR